MYLTDDERNALLRVGGTADRRGYFDKNKVFTEHNVLTLRNLQDKGLISREHEQYFLTPAGIEALHNARQSAQNRVEKDSENRKSNKVSLAHVIIGALLTAFFGWLFSLFAGGVG